ncbi:hypothetical protein EG329_008265 [Mollisiaceae sp. DMI_Dod_QoI]|nr:hypothetical protein EG329_008265 [Helotiales sp. DMI_Dod_QoI]
MSFGVGFGDIVTAIDLLLTSYNNIHNAPKVIGEAKVDLEYMRSTAEQLIPYFGDGHTSPPAENMKLISMYNDIIRPLKIDLQDLQEVLKKWPDPPTPCGVVVFGMVHNGTVQQLRKQLADRQARFTHLLSLVTFTILHQGNRVQAVTSHDASTDITDVSPDFYIARNIFPTLPVFAAVGVPNSHQSMVLPSDRTADPLQDCNQPHGAGEKSGTSSHSIAAGLPDSALFTRSINDLESITETIRSLLWSLLWHPEARVTLEQSIEIMASFQTVVINIPALKHDLISVSILAKQMSERLDKEGHLSERVVKEM